MRLRVCHNLHSIYSISKFIILFALILSLTACNIVKISPGKVWIKSRMDPPDQSDPMDTLPACSSESDASIFEVTRITNEEVLIRLVGIKQNGISRVIIHRDVPRSAEGYDTINELSISKDASFDGDEYIQQIGGLEPLPGMNTNRWAVRVVYASGVACSSIDLFDKEP